MVLMCQAIELFSLFTFVHQIESSTLHLRVKSLDARNEIVLNNNYYNVLNTLKFYDAFMKLKFSSILDVFISFICTLGDPIMRKINYNDYLFNLLTYLSISPICKSKDMLICWRNLICLCILTLS